MGCFRGQQVSDPLLNFIDRQVVMFAENVANGFALIGRSFASLFTRKKPEAEKPEPRYPEYLWTEVWGLDNYHSLHPKTDAEILSDMFGKAGELLKIHERQIEGYRYKVISELDRIKSKPSK
jgi:hypothetical protein